MLLGVAIGFEPCGTAPRAFFAAGTFIFAGVAVPPIENDSRRLDSELERSINENEDPFRLSRDCVSAT